VNSIEIKMDLRATLYQLKVKDLKRELEERDLETTGNKSTLQGRLQEALIAEGKSAEDANFELEESLSSVLKKLVTIEEQSKSLKEELLETFTDHSRRLDEKFEKQFTNVEAKLLEEAENRRRELKEIERKFQEQLDHLQETIEEVRSPAPLPVNMASSVSARSTTIRLQTPTFDGKAPWARYLCSFENVAEAYSWTEEEKASALRGALRDDAIEIVQRLTAEEKRSYHVLVDRLEKRYGNGHLEQVHRIELKGRKQRPHETLQEFESDLIRLMGLAYPTRPAEYVEEMSKELFIDGIKDPETATTVRMARPKTLGEALAIALEYETATQASRGPSRVRSLTEEGIEEVVQRVLEKSMDRKSSRLRCWGCGQIGHIKRKCRKPLETEEGQPSEN